MKVDRRVVGWRLWYDDGAEFDSRRHSVADLPTHGVQVGMTYHADGTRRIAMGDDVFWISPRSGVQSRMRNPGGRSRKLFGRQMPDADYWALHDRAMAAEEAP